MLRTVTSSSVVGTTLRQIISNGIKGQPASSRRFKYTLVLTRHGESVWNKENKFTGWYDVPLSNKGHEEAAEGGQILNDAGFKFDLAYTSYLKRAIMTCDHTLEATNCLWIPVVKAWELNERHYGALTGLDKQETVNKYGKDQVLIWRRSFDVPPPDVDLDSEYYPANDPMYRNVQKDLLPRAESLKLTAARVLPYWEKEIVPQIKSGKKILIAAHGNSLRALVMHLDQIGEDEITELNIPTATPLCYELDENMKPIPQEGSIAPLSGRYIGNLEEIKARIDGVKNQTK
jgi:2,3-bisphosphoglycerate-dependent phosphoglycerate mutase